MNNLFYSTICFLCLTSPLQAQDKHDFNWLLGYPLNIPGQLFGGSFLDFNTGNVDTSFFELQIPMETSITVSDSAGRFQFYTNACRIINAQNQVMENGDSINSGYFFDNFCNSNSVGYLSGKGVLALPYPGRTNEYVYLHCRRYHTMDTFDVLYTTIDMKANNGLGKVTEKAKILEKGFLYRDYTATRHANGRDWWFLCHKKGQLSFHKYLLNPDGFHGPYIQDLPSVSLADAFISISDFSPDGTKLMAFFTSLEYAVRIYDFDRCSGLISNEKVINLLPDTTLYAQWGCFSPNSRYFYMTNYLDAVYQFDLEASDIKASRIQVGARDTSWVSFYGYGTGPFAMALAPDGRIYITGGGGAVHVLHVIEEPDQPGLACRYRPQGLSLPSHALFFPPNNPNYRLYNLKGSPCDTLGIVPPMEAYWRWEFDTATNAAAVQFRDLSYHEPSSWYWDFGDGSSATEQSPHYTYQSTGTFTACLEACNANGVCDSQCHDIEILTVNTGTPKPDPDPLLRIAPNPANQQIQVHIETKRVESTSVRIRLIHPNGMLVEEKHSTLNGSGDFLFATHSIASGIYLIQVWLESGEIETRRVVVIH